MSFKQSDLANSSERKLDSHDGAICDQIVKDTEATCNTSFDKS